MTHAAWGYVVACWLGILVGFLMALWWVGSRPRNVYDEVRVVDVPQLLGICAGCGEPLRPGPPHQLYLELWDVHGRQRDKWAVGEGEQLISVKATDAVGVARVNRQVWAAVVRCNDMDQKGAA